MSTHSTSNELRKLINLVEQINLQEADVKPQTKIKDYDIPAPYEFEAKFRAASADELVTVLTDILHIVSGVKRVSKDKRRSGMVQNTQREILGTWGIKTYQDPTKKGK